MHTKLLLFMSKFCFIVDIKQWLHVIREEKLITSNKDLLLIVIHLLIQLLRVNKILLSFFTAGGSLIEPR